MGVERMDLLLKSGSDVDGDVGTERIWTLEEILEVKKYRILFQRRCLRSNIGDRNQIGRILDQNARIAVIRVIVVGTRCHHDIGIPLADFANNLESDIYAGHQLSVMII